VATAGSFFNEFVVETPAPAAEVVSRLLDEGILGGLDLSVVDPALDHHLLVCATEMNARDSIDRMVSALPR
jgi:glycine dehydrogenase subunit 1